ncbi:MAG: 4-hydroxy-tetrahydrodipicolinate reductase [Candidatus Micrarchaeia archaeon]
MLRICVFGAGGHMGRAVAAEALASYSDRIKIVSALERPNAPELGKSVPGTDVIILSSEGLEEALKVGVDCVVSFSAPNADAAYAPRIAAKGIDLVIGTTGFAEEQLRAIEEGVRRSRASAVIAPNFSPLVNAQFYLTREAAKILAPYGYDYGIIEEHHVMKKDAPSGTAKKLAREIVGVGAAREIVYRGEGLRERVKGELDMAVLRLGGTAGEHEVRVVGQHGRLTIGTLMYNRSDFARGALEAALWLQKNRKPGKIFSMEDVMGLK